MGFIAADSGGQVFVNGGCLATVFLGYSTLNSFSLTAAHRILLVAAHDVGLVAAYRGLLVCLDVGNLGIEVFLFRTFYIDRTVSGHSIGLVDSYIVGFVAPDLGIQVGFVIFRHIAGYGFLQGAFHRTGFIAADSGGQVIVNGVGHIFVSPIHQVLSRMGNHSFFSGILDIRSSLLGVGLVCSVTSEGIESVIAQVGGGFVISINYSNLSFSCILADGGVLVRSVHCFVFHGEGAVIIADHFSSDVLLGAFWFCVIAQVLADFFRPYDGFSCGVYDPFIGSDGDRAAVFIENGFCTVVHSANLVIDFGCHIAAINGSVVIFCIHRAGKSLGIKGSVDGQVRHTGDCACGSDFHRADFAGCCCDFALCINGKVSSRPFDGAIPFQSCASMFIIIATGIEPVFVHDSTIQAYFDSIFAEGNLVFAIFVQHQFIYSRGCGAVVSGDFGNHAVVAHFEIILVGLFTSNCFSFDLPIQASNFFA